jgi:hypothetical protein
VWCSPGQRDLFSRALTAKPLDRSMARWIPERCDNAGLYALDPRIAPDRRARAPARGGAARHGARHRRPARFRGVDLDNDLFANLGATLAGFARRLHRLDPARHAFRVPRLQVENEAGSAAPDDGRFDDPAVKQREQLSSVAAARCAPIR